MQKLDVQSYKVFGAVVMAFILSIPVNFLQYIRFKIFRKVFAPNDTSSIDVFILLIVILFKFEFFQVLEKSSLNEKV